MFGFEDIMCCSRVSEEEEYLPSAQFCSPTDIYHIPVVHFHDGKSARDSSLEEEQNKSTAHRHQWGEFAEKPWMGIATRRSTPSRCIHVACMWVSEAPLQARFSVLDDWATALHAHHVKDVVHGNLTPNSVDIVHGRGTLRDPFQGWPPDRHVSWTRGSLDDDVHGARWAATELFRIDNDEIHPTRMSDVYSFACLMLQMLTGEVPYCGTKRSEQVVYLKYLGREPIDAQTPKVADHYVAFMRWCWSPEPEKRPTMETVIRHIRQEIKRLEEQRG